MPNTKLTKQKLSNHFHYAKWPYIIVILVAALVGDLIFTMTQYRAPNERKVDIQLVSSYALVDNVDACTQVALAAGQAYELVRDEAAGIDITAKDYEVPLQEVNVSALNYDPNGNDEASYYGSQKYMVMLAAQEGDIYILSRMLMEDLVDQGVTADLTPFIEQGIIDPGERDLSRVTYPQIVEDGEAPSDKTCIYALQAESMTGMIQDLLFDPTDKYMVIMAYSKNQDTAAAVMQSLIEQFEPEEEPVCEEAPISEEATN